MATYSYEDVAGVPSAPSSEKPKAKNAYSYEEVASGTAPEKTGALTRSADEGWLSGAAKGAATGVLKGLANIPGYAGNLRAMGDYGFGYLTGETPEQVRKKREAHSLLPHWLSPDIAPTGPELAAPILEKTGEYKPESTVGKMGEAAVEAAVSAFGPGGGGARGTGAVPAPSFGKPWLPKSPSLSPKDVGAVARETVKQAPLNALSGAAAEGVYDQTHHGGLAFLAGLLAPGAAEVATNVARNVTRPMRTSQHEAMAGEHLEGMMHDPAAVRETLWPSKGPAQDFVLKGSQPTLGQLTGDVGLLSEERAARKETPSFDLNEANRNTTRLNALRAIEPGANTGEVAKTVRNYHNALESNLTALEAQLTKEAQTKAEKLGPAANPEVIGADLRNAIEAERLKTKQQVSRLYDAIDPEGKLTIVGEPVRKSATSIIENIDPLGPPLTGDAERVFNTAASIPDVVPFKSLIELDKNITDALRSERRANGESNSWRLLSKLKSDTQGAIDNAIENQHAYEQQAVARGEMAPEETGFERLLKEREDFLRSRGEGRLTAEAGPAGGSGAAYGVLGNAGSASARSRDAGRFEGSSGERGLEPTFDEAAAGRLGTAKQAHRDYSTTYKAEPVAGAIKTTGFSGQYATPSSAIPGKAFPSGDKGYQTATAFLKAAKDAPEAVTAMQEAALNALRKTAVKDGVLSPDKLAKWKADHALALRALDEKVPGFSAGFDDAAKATEKLTDFAIRSKKLRDDFEKSAFGDFIGVKEPDEIENAVGKMLTAQRGAVANIRQMVKGMPPQAVEGMRKAAADWIGRRMTNVAEAVGAEEKRLSYAKIDALLKNNGAALAELFTPEQMNTLRALRRDMELSDRTVQAARSPTNPSGTAKDVQGSLQALSKQIKDTSIWMAMLGAVRDAYREGGVFGAAAVGVPAASWAGLTHFRGIGAKEIHSLVVDALQNPAVARQLLMKIPPKQVKNRFDVLSNSVRRGLLSSMQNDEMIERPQRIKRASGGRAMASTPQTAQSLLAAVKRARKAIQSQTEAILAQPDETVVRALSAVKEKI